MKIKLSGSSAIIKLSKKESSIQWDQLENYEQILQCRQIEILAKENLHTPNFTQTPLLNNLTLSGESLEQIENISELQLTKLKISGSDLNEIPKINFHHLTHLSLPRNKVEIASLKFDTNCCLQELDLGQNQITKLDINFSFFPKLKRMNLEHNQITDLPDELFELKELSHLALKGNPLSEKTQQRLYDVFKIVFE